MAARAVLRFAFCWAQVGITSFYWLALLPSEFERTGVLENLEVLEVEREPETLVADLKRADLHDEIVLVVARENARVLHGLSLGVPELPVAKSPSS